MLHRIRAKLAGVAAVGAVTVGGLGVAGALPGPLDLGGGDDTLEQQSVPESAQRGKSFAAAMQEWAACVADAAAVRGDSDDETGAFDPFAACGELPHPSDFGIGGGLAAGVPGGVPAGPPDGVPAGPPDGVPAGPPEGVPWDPPSGVPTGRP